MVEFGLPEAVDVSLRLYDVKGSLVSELINGHMSAGCHAFNWQPTGLASGTYLMRLEAGSQARVIKVVMLK
jgi:flagellar hook assembly protein FlgD